MLPADQALNRTQPSWVSFTRPPVVQDRLAALQPVQVGAAEKGAARQLDQPLVGRQHGVGEGEGVGLGQQPPVEGGQRRTGGRGRHRRQGGGAQPRGREAGGGL